MASFTSTQLMRVGHALSEFLRFAPEASLHFAAQGRYADYALRKWLAHHPRPAAQVADTAVLELNVGRELGELQLNELAAPRLQLWLKVLRVISPILQKQDAVLWYLLHEVKPENLHGLLLISFMEHWKRLWALAPAQSVVIDACHATMAHLQHRKPRGSTLYLDVSKILNYKLITPKHIDLRHRNPTRFEGLRPLQRELTYILDSLPCDGVRIQPVADHVIISFAQYSTHLLLSERPSLLPAGAAPDALRKLCDKAVLRRARRKDEGSPGVGVYTYSRLLALRDLEIRGTVPGAADFVMKRCRGEHKFEHMHDGVMWHLMWYRDQLWVKVPRSAMDNNRIAKLVVKRGDDVYAPQAGLDLLDMSYGSLFNDITVEWVQTYRRKLRHHDAFERLRYMDTPQRSTTPYQENELQALRYYLSGRPNTPINKAVLDEIHARIVPYRGRKGLQSVVKQLALDYARKYGWKLYRASGYFCGDSIAIRASLAEKGVVVCQVHRTAEPGCVPCNYEGSDE